MAKKSKKSKKSVKLFQLNLTELELTHIRDMVSVLLPPDLTQTVSQALAKSQDRSLIESKLWAKISKACEEAELPIGEFAPDYIVAPAGVPPMGVFLIADNAQQLSSSDEQEGSQINNVFDMIMQSSKNSTTGAGDDDEGDDDEADEDES